MNVLIVEDNPDDCYLLHKALIKAGIQNVNTTRSGKDAAQYLGGLPPHQFREIPDLIFVDIGLDGINGFELIRWMRQNVVFKNTPVIVLSGDVTSRERKTAMDLGVKAVYQKPDLHEDLVRIVKETLDQIP